MESKKILTEEIIPSLKQQVESAIPTLPQWIVGGGNNGILLQIRDNTEESLKINYAVIHPGSTIPFNNSLVLEGASSTKAGLMTSADKATLSELQNSIGDIEMILQKINGGTTA